MTFRRDRVQKPVNYIPDLARMPFDSCHVLGCFFVWGGEKLKIILITSNFHPAAYIFT